MTEDTPAVALEAVTKRFDTVTAVDDVHLRIRDGEFFSLLGPSGCGKTTTLRMIGGFEMPTTGEVYICGEPQGFTPAFKRPVNTVFQNYALFPHMTVFENTAFGLEMKKVPKGEIESRVSEALEMVRLIGMGNRKPKQLSGGQQQRVALARALINRPAVLLLDEPLGALDLKLRKAMQLELKELQERVGITFIYVTHDQEEALTMSDRIGVMRRGKLLQVGSPKEVYESPTSRFVADFIGDSNYVVGKVSQLAGDQAEVVLDSGERVRANATPGLAEKQRVTIAFRPEKVQINIEPDNPQAENQLTCKVTDVVYTGSFTTYLMHTRTDAEIMVRQQNRAETLTTVYRPGEEVRIYWPVIFTKAFYEPEEVELEPPIDEAEEVEHQPSS